MGINAIEKMITKNIVLLNRFNIRSTVKAIAQPKSEEVNTIKT